MLGFRLGAIRLVQHVAILLIYAVLYTVAPLAKGNSKVLQKNPPQNKPISESQKGFRCTQRMNVETEVSCLLVRLFLCCHYKHICL